MFSATLKPAQVELVARPGINLTQAYNVVNNSSSPIVVSASVLPWKPKGTDGSVNYEGVPTSPNFEFSLANSDLRLNQSFVLRPAENRQLVLKIKSNSATPVGDNYFTFFINQDQSGQLNSDSTGGQATGRLGSHLLISTANTEDPPSTLKTASITLSPRFTDIFFPRVNINGIISNESDYFAKATGKVTVSHRGKIVTETELFPHNVLSHSDRSLACLSNNEPIPCILHPPFWPGVYTVTINNQSANFYVLPFSLIIFGVFVGSFIYSLIKKSSRT
ncbi:hypothetical protein HYV64_04080 [Candidatus Shapirobacteria bacterium]|nr:hypothetical protein [Candidatus Shapirobacteria bacterium]